MNLAHLYYFKKLVEVGNYSVAAKELYIAQPTLSLAISSLEKELGTALVLKKRTYLELTEEGELFFQAVVTATNSLDNAVTLINERISASCGKIRVGVVYSIQDQTWSEALHAFRKASNCHAHLHLKQGTTESLISNLRKGVVDVVFAGILKGGDPDIESIPCFSQRVSLIVHKSNPLAAQSEVSLKDLAGHHVITYRNKQGPFAAEISSLLKGYRNIDIDYEYNDEISLCSLVTADPDLLGIACHSWLVDSFPDIVPLHIKEAPVDFHRFYISYRKKERLPFAVEEFIKFMRTYNFGNVSPNLRSIPESEYVLLDFDRGGGISFPLCKPVLKGIRYE